MAKKANQEPVEEQRQQNEALSVDDADENDAEEVDLDDFFDDDYVEPEQIIADNEKYLGQFEADLMNSGLKENTIGRHLGNADLFINEWLAAHEGCVMADGPMEIGHFLGDWFIRRCMWSTPGNIKTTATSIKKFYKSMLDHGNIAQLDYELLLQTIKTEMPDWQRKCALYNDPYNEWDDIADEFGFF